jgi:hypothetical protein
MQAFERLSEVLMQAGRLKADSNVQAAAVAHRLGIVNDTRPTSWSRRRRRREGMRSTTAMRPNRALGSLQAETTEPTGQAWWHAG